MFRNGLLNKQIVVDNIKLSMPFWMSRESEAPDSLQYIIPICGPRDRYVFWFPVPY